MTKMPARATVQLRIELANRRRIGPGKIALLEAIDGQGSIAAAARALGMSYRRAWLLLDDLKAAFGAPLVAPKTGGVRGGGAALEPLGRALVKSYRRAERKAEALVTRELAALAALKEAAPPAAKARGSARP